MTPIEGVVGFGVIALIGYALMVLGFVFSTRITEFIEKLPWNRRPTQFTSQRRRTFNTRFAAAMFGFAGVIGTAGTLYHASRLH